MDSKEQEIIEYLKEKDDEIKALKEENEKLVEETLSLTKKNMRKEEDLAHTDRQMIDLMMDNIKAEQRIQDEKRVQYFYLSVIIAQCLIWLAFIGFK